MLPKLPEINKGLIQDVETTLVSLNVEKDEAKALTDLNFVNNGPILTMEDRYFIYEVLGMLKKVGYEETYKFLNQGWEYSLGIRKKMLFESPLMRRAREKFQVDMEIYRNKPDPVTHGEKCLKCQSDSTISITTQTKSSDEISTIKVKCLQCGFRWTAQ